MGESGPTKICAMVLNPNLHLKEVHSINSKKKKGKASLLSTMSEEYILKKV